MNEFNERQLEEWMNREVRELPPVKAPATLSARVMEAIHIREAAQWYRRSWESWPRPLRLAFFATGMALLVGIVLAGAAGSQLLEAMGVFPVWVGDQLAGWHPYLDGVVRASGSFGSLMDGAGVRWVWALVGVLAAAYGTCIALGTLGYRLVFNRI